MNPYAPSPWILAATSAPAAFFYVRLVLTRRRTRQALAELDSARKEIDRARTAPQAWEFRVERFEVVWHPTIVTDPVSRRITRVTPGTPLCPSCVKPLALNRKGGRWICAECDSVFSASFDDLSVVDAVNQQAVKYFRERHPEYSVAPNGQGKGD